MSMSVGASSSSALSYLQQLLQQGSAGATGASNASDPLSELLQVAEGDSSSEQTGTAASQNASGGSTSSPFGADMLSALISLQSEQTQQASPLFSKLDGDSDGSISQSEFETAAADAGASKDTADAVFAKIDGDGDGSISQSELAKVDHGGGHHHHIGGGGQGGGDSLDALTSGTDADGATTQTTTNADGSTTTTVSYADGSKIDMTTPAAAAAGGNSSGGSINKSASNLLEQLIKLQSQMLSAATSTLSAVA